MKKVGFIVITMLMLLGCTQGKTLVCTYDSSDIETTTYRVVYNNKEVLQSLSVETRFKGLDKEIASYLAKQEAEFQESMKAFEGYTVTTEFDGDDFLSRVSLDVNKTKLTELDTYDPIVYAFGVFADQNSIKDMRFYIEKSGPMAGFECN